MEYRKMLVSTTLEYWRDTRIARRTYRPGYPVLRATATAYRDKILFKPTEAQEAMIKRGRRMGYIDDDHPLVDCTASQCACEGLAACFFQRKRFADERIPEMVESFMRFRPEHLYMVTVYLPTFRFDAAPFSTGFKPASAMQHVVRGLQRLQQNVENSIAAVCRIDFSCERSGADFALLPHAHLVIGGAEATKILRSLAPRYGQASPDIQLVKCKPVRDDGAFHYALKTKLGGYNVPRDAAFIGKNGKPKKKAAPQSLNDLFVQHLMQHRVSQMVRRFQC